MSIKEGPVKCVLVCDKSWVILQCSAEKQTKLIKAYCPNNNYIYCDKGQQVQMNLYAMHRHEQHWGADADKFRPHRFLDENHCVKHDEWLQPFGYGENELF